ncbi:MAG: gfo/Idh/MocA family oxidoreductase [Phycisphaera sp.]|nr:gfo/Idh/MocA family oxidoreductase [Phycisphaera sp.]
MTQPIQRRTFIKSIAVAGLTAPLLTPLVKGAAANEKLVHASIGVNGMGWGDLHSISSHSKVQIAAICDVDLERRKKAEGHVPDARRYQDWRELLDKEGDKIDSVNVTVPDHNHALITTRALAMKKNVYCQKPLCHDVAECRVVAEATRQAGTITQLGTQHASRLGDRLAVAWLKSGVIGKIKHVYLCSNRPGAIETYRRVGPKPAQGEPVPASLNWDIWLGTAQDQFYFHEYHPTIWRSWQDFGTGWSGDIGCHIYDAVWKSIGLTAPKTVQANVQDTWKNDPARRRDVWPQSDHITWTFPGTDMTEGDELTVEWFDGLFYPPEEIRALYTASKNYPAESAMFIGTKGALLLPHTAGPLLIGVEATKPDLKPRVSHYHHWIDACLGGEMCESHFLQTGPMTEAILLGTVAIRVPDTLIKWDPAKMTTDNAEANKLLKRTYRSGWEVPGVA